jgi:hypothetical protein
MKITPPVSYYMSSNTGTVEIEHGIFIKCSKSKKSTITSFIKEASTQEATQPISLQQKLNLREPGTSKISNREKIMKKYLISSDSESSEEEKPPKKIKSNK